MSRENNCPASLNTIAKRGSQHRGARRVERPRRLVEHQDLRIVEVRAAKGKCLPHSGRSHGERNPKRLRKRGEPRLPLSSGMGDGLLTQSAKSPEDAQVLQARQPRKKSAVSRRHETDSAANLPRGIPHAHPPDPRVTRAWGRQGGNHSEQSRLAAPVGTDERDPAAEGSRQPIRAHHLAASEHPSEPLEPNRFPLHFSNLHRGPGQAIPFSNMRLVTFIDTESRQETLGLQWGPPGTGKIAHLPRALAAGGAAAPPRDILELVRDWERWEPACRKALASAEAGGLPADCVMPEAKTRLLSPIPRPVSMRDGYAFRQHVEAARRNRGAPMIPEFDHFPVFYFTNHLAVTGPGDVAVQRLAREKLDFELEVAVVIGRPGRNIPASRADEHVFGYLIMNDWSARALQLEEMKLNLGPAKGKDFATSLGPYLVTRGELATSAIPGASGERHDLRMRCLVNGKPVSEGNLKDMTWTFAQILERASYGVDLHVGEVIGSGTVGTGCFLELNGSKITDNQWLQPNDEVILEVDRLGRLVNRILAVEP